MNRQERIGLHNKQDRLQISSGVPNIRDVQEGVPVLRKTAEGLVRYTKYKNSLYKEVLNRARVVSKSVLLDSGRVSIYIDYDSGWIDMPSESSGGTLTHGVAGIDPNGGKLFGYNIYLRNALNAGTADRWILWNGDSQEDNDHFTVAFNDTQFLYHQDSDDGDTRVKWGVDAGTEETAFESCSFRILAWKLF